MRFWLTFSILFLICSPAGAISTYDADKSATLILSYHYVGNSENANQNINTNQFESHLATLRAAKKNITHISKLFEKPGSVAITFDKFNIRTFDKLIKNNIPFAVFITPESLSKHEEKWITKNNTKNVIFGLSSRFNDINDTQRSRKNLHEAITAFRTLTKKQPRYFSYSEGAYNAEIQELLRENGFEAAFSQRSGIAYKTDDVMALPRFVMTSAYAGLERFEMITNALPLPAKAVTPNSMIVHTDTPSIGITLPSDLENKQSIDCFASEQDKPALKWIGGQRLEIRLQSALQPYERTRINCILSAGENEQSGAKTWRWTGWLLQYQP